jgi:hypothetical protein
MIQDVCVPFPETLAPASGASLVKFQIEVAAMRPTAAKA